MPWLHNKTVAIFGDSIDRDHIEYVSISIILVVAILTLRSTCTTGTRADDTVLLYFTVLRDVEREYGVDMGTISL